MREILFRAKTHGNNEWIFGDLICDSGFCLIWKNLPRTEPIWVREYTVGQYTGVKTKIGTKIFEGDIVKISLSGEPVIGVVEWATTKIACFNVKTFDKVKSNYVLETDKSNIYEIIGNKFDNPELLEVEE